MKKIFANDNFKLRINRDKSFQERMGLGGNGGREELARENLELKASDQNFAPDLHPGS